MSKYGIRIVCYHDGTTRSEDITEAEWLEGQESIRTARYYSFRPSFWRDRPEVDPYAEFKWWRLRITFQVWRGSRGLCFMWGDNTKPPVYHTLLALRQEAPHEPITVGR